jgi:hypothetical protein
VNSRPRSHSREKPISNEGLKKGKNTGTNKHKSKVSGKLKYSGVKRPHKKQLNSSGKQKHSEPLHRLPPYLRGIPEHIYELLEDYTLTSDRPVCLACVSVLEAASVTTEEFSLIALKSTSTESTFPFPLVAVPIRVCSSPLRVAFTIPPTPLTPSGCSKPSKNLPQRNAPAVHQAEVTEARRAHLNTFTKFAPAKITATSI